MAMRRSKSSETKGRAALNQLTDIEGVQVGNAADEGLRSGVTVILFDEPAVTSCSVLGGAPALRDSGCLEPDMAVEAVDGLAFSGGSGFGLDAASGVQAWLREKGRGFNIGPARIPIVPQAICFDLLNGGDKDWGRYPPYRELAYSACEAASAGPFELGTVGAGYGATTVTLKGGLGSASAVTPSGYTVAALAVVNAIGSATIGEGPHFWAAPYEVGNEFGGVGLPGRITPEMMKLAWKGGPQQATTLAAVVTDAALTKAQAKRLAIAANDGFARALRIAHALFDGDAVFASATGRLPLKDRLNDQIEIGAVAADCVARAIARGVYEAKGFGSEWPKPPAWKERFGRITGIRL